jgi:methylmalonyl-CoA mutase N-terminal domain/subunit
MFDKERLANLEKRYIEWQRTTLAKVLKKFPEREPGQPMEMADTKRLYSPLDMAGLDYERDLGFPGEYPFTRGIHATMYRGRLWTSRQYTGFDTPEETNKRFKYLLKMGGDSVALACDLPTQLGYDPDSPIAKPEVGRIGMSCPSLREAEIAFEGIPADKVRLNSSISAAGAIFWSMYIAAAEKQGVSLDKIGGTLVTDVLQEYASRNTYIFSLKGQMRLSTDLMEYIVKNMPQMYFMISNETSFALSGGSLVQRLAFSLAVAIAYMQVAIDRGLDVDELGPRVSFNVEVHPGHIFEEAARLRAQRKLWAKIMKERFGAKKPESLMCRIGSATGGVRLTAQEPENNIVRVTLGCLAAVLGGVQSLNTGTMDDAYNIPSDKAMKLAVRTQQIVAYESGIADVVDPLGGSYYVEALTRNIEEDAMKLIETIDAMGGMVNAVESGWVKRELANSAYKYQREIDEGKRTIVGVNKFQEDERVRIEPRYQDPQVVISMIERVRKLRAERDHKAVEESLASLRKAAGGRDNLIPFILEAVKAYATVGEICGVLKDVLGEYQLKTL